MDHEESKADNSVRATAGFSSELLEQADRSVQLKADAQESGEPFDMAGHLEVLEAPEPVSAVSESEQDDGEVGREEALEAEPLTDAELNEVIADICNSKAEEFRMLGYEQVIGRDIWECVNDRYHKTGTPPLHKVVNDILSLKVTQFMNWMTMSIYKSESPFKY
jgi:hypothetical protein